MTTHPIPILGAPPSPRGDGEVLRVLQRRAARGSRADGNRVALVISGGGMRAAYAGGMAHALEDAGLGDCFDVIYGSSAGAYIGASLLLGCGHGAGHIFFEDLACRAFIDPRRLGTRRPVVSLNHLIDHVLVHSKPMDWERLAASPVPLRVVATAADDLRPHALDPATPQEWKVALRATAAIPLLAGPPVEFHGRRWMDGSVAEPVPVLRALRDGATHVLVLLNRTGTELRRPDPGTGPGRWARTLDRLAPGLGLITQESLRHGPALAVLDDVTHPSRGDAHLLALTPEHDLDVHGLTIDAPRVAGAAAAGYATVAAALARMRIPAQTSHGVAMSSGGSVAVGPGGGLVVGGSGL